MLHFFHRTKTVAVQDLSAAYDGLRLADPHEPDYRDGADAIFHWRGGDWRINSFAHGIMHTYRAVPVPPPDPDEEDMADLLSRAPETDTTAPAKGKRSHADILLALAGEAHLVHTTEGRRFAVVTVQGHKEVLGIGEKGSGFREWLIQRFRATQEGLPQTNALAQALEALSAEARFAGERRDVYTRIVAHHGRIYLDLANDAWEVIEIDAQGWRILPEAPVYFRRPRGMLPLPVPDSEGTIEDFFVLLPVPADSEESYLITGWMVGAFQPHGGRAILGIHGEQGSTKSTLTRHLRGLLDPNKAPARSAPREERDLAIAATNSAIVALENLSHLPEWLSDVLCSLSTGAGFSTRSLYTDDDEAIFSIQRPVVMNGIAEVAIRGDLIDRSIFVTLPQMPPDQRKTERAVDSEFQRLHPKALGALLDAVSTALANQEAVTNHFPSLPRMADFVLWVEAAAPALGWDRGRFFTIYATNRTQAARLELEASSVATHFLGWLATDAKKEEVLMKDLLQILTDRVTDFQKRKEPPGWPRSAQSLSAHLKRYAPALRREGWDIVSHPRNEKGRCVSFVKRAPTPDEVADEPRQPQKFVRSSSADNTQQNSSMGKTDEDDELFCSLYILKKREKRRKREEEKRQKEGENGKKPMKCCEERERSSRAPKSSSGSSVRHEETILPQDGQTHGQYHSTVNGTTAPLVSCRWCADEYPVVEERQSDGSVLVRCTHCHKIVTIR